jgi:hypothetical protein
MHSTYRPYYYLHKFKRNPKTTPSIYVRQSIYNTFSFNATRSNVTSSNATRSNVTSSNATRSNVTRSNVTSSNATSYELTNFKNLKITNVNSPKSSEAIEACNDPLHHPLRISILMDDLRL